MNAVLQSATPNFSPEQARLLAERYFGIEGEARLLTSERDQNFHLRAPDGRQYVLKIANAAEDLAVVAFQNAVLEHIARADDEAPTPRVVRALDGRDFVCERGSFVRVLTWLSGSLMHQVERTRLLRQSLGRVHGRLARAMQACAAPAPDQDLMWDLQRAATLRSLLNHISDPNKRLVIARTLDVFEGEVAPVLRRMQPQIIHNDLNPHNVVVNREGEVGGVIDFGDMVRAPLVCDVAVAAAYHVRADAAPLADAAEYVAAFHAVRPLTRAELSMLPDLVRTRLAMSVLISTWRAARHPENEEYILRNAPAAWAGLRAMSEAEGPQEFAP